MTPDPILEQLAAELRQPNRDMTEIIVSIHVSCMWLELQEPGMWWDFDEVRLRLRHLAVMEWMEQYGFSKIADLSPAALIAFDHSLKRRIEVLDRALPHAQ